MKRTTILLTALSLILLSACQPKDTATITDEAVFSFVFMTDIHVQPEKRAVEGLQLALDKANALNPDFILTGGDNVMDVFGQTTGRADTLFSIWEEFVENNPIEIKSTMGNHDHFGINTYDESQEGYDRAMYEKRVKPAYYSFDHKGWHFMVLDVIEPLPEERGYRGYVDAEQLEWIKSDLAEVNPETPIMISAHIPFYSIMTQTLSDPTQGNSKGLVVVNANEVLEAFKAHNLKAVLQGHLHFLEDIYVNGVHFITGGAVSSSWWNGPYRGMEEGFLHLELGKDDFSWEYIDYGWEVAPPAN